MRVQYYFAFYFLFFINFLQPILSTNPSSKVLLDKMDKFHDEIEKKILKFDENMNAISSKEKESFMLDKRFENAMFEKEELTPKIRKAKIELKEYLKGEIKFTNILNSMNNLKLEKKKLKDLKRLEEELTNQRRLMLHFGRTVPTDEYDPGLEIETINEHLELAEILVEIHELVIEFVDEMIAELRIGRIKMLLKTLEHHIKEQKRKINKPFDDFVKKHSWKFFPKIEEFIKTAKGKLQTAFKEMTLPKEDLLPSKLKEDRDKLRETIFNPSNQLLEKVKLNAIKIKWVDSTIDNLGQYFVKIAKILNKDVDDLLNQINDYFSNEQKHEFEKLKAEWDDFISLDIICKEMFNRIWTVVDDSKLSFIDKNINLADIHWLTEFIEEKLAKIEGKRLIQISNMEKAIEMEELPNELELNVENDPKNEAILIVQNMLFIVAQLDKLYNLKEIANFIMLNKYARFNEIIQKNLMPKEIGQFFYQKYGEMKKGEQQKLSNGMEQNKIGEQHINSNGFGRFGRK